MQFGMGGEKGKGGFGSGEEGRDRWLSRVRQEREEAGERRW